MTVHVLVLHWKHNVRTANYIVVLHIFECAFLGGHRGLISKQREVTFGTFPTLIWPEACSGGSVHENVIDGDF